MGECYIRPRFATPLAKYAHQLEIFDGLNWLAGWLVGWLAGCAPNVIIPYVLDCLIQSSTETVTFTVRNASTTTRILKRSKRMQKPVGNQEFRNRNISLYVGHFFACHKRHFQMIMTLMKPRGFEDFHNSEGLVEGNFVENHMFLCKKYTSWNRHPGVHSTASQRTNSQRPAEVAKPYAQRAKWIWGT